MNPSSSTSSSSCPPATDPPLSGLIDFYQGLTPQRLDEQLARFYAPDAYFKDPFNEVQGLQAIRAIFEHMFGALEDPRFEVLRSLVDAPAQPRHGFITWVFHCGRSGHRFAIRGASELDFDTLGRITRHRDYWDPAEELYAKLPLIGAPVRWLGRRFASSTQTSKG